MPLERGQNRAILPVNIAHPAQGQQTGAAQDRADCLVLAGADLKQKMPARCKMALCTGGDGTEPTKALCLLQAGVDLLGATKKWVRVAPSATAYARITVARKIGW